MIYTTRYISRLRFVVASMLLTTFMCPADAMAEGDSDGCIFRSQIVLKNGEFMHGVPTQVGYFIANIGKVSCKLPSDLLPEGWMIRLSVKDQAGLVVYTSPIVKVEMTREKIQEQTILRPNYMYGVEIEFGQLLAPGDYVVEGAFSTAPLSGRNIQGVPLGTWAAPPIKFKVLKK